MDKKEYELTFPQKNIWLTDRSNEKKYINNILGIINIKENFDEAICEKVLNNLIKRNDIFRIRLNLNEDSILQHFVDYKYEKIKYNDFSIYKDNKEKNKKIEEHLKYISNKSIDILKDKLYYIGILRYTNNTGAVIILKNHLITDAWSASQIVNQFMEDYNNILNKLPLNSEQIPQYIEYIQKEKDYLESKRYLDDKEFFKNYLSKVQDVISLKNNNNLSNIKASRYTFELDEELNEMLNLYSKKNKVSIYSIFLAILSIYLYRVLEKKDIILGTPILNRSNFLEKKILGMFISTMPIRIIIEENITFSYLVNQISSNVFKLLRHQKYPYINILDDVHSENEIKGNLYNIILSYQNAKTVIDNDIFSTEWKFGKSIQDELQMHIIETENKENEKKINIYYDYQNSAFLEEEIMYINKRLINILKTVIINENINIEEIDIIDKEEKNKILNEFNNTTCDYPRDKTVLDIFEENVIKFPNKIALAYKDQKLTYKELNEKANQLAFYLKDNFNIKSNDIVGMILKKGLNQIVSIFAIMKLGATYLPILYNWPKDRIEYILKDSNSKLIIVDSDNYIENDVLSKVNINDIDFNIYLEKNLNYSKTDQVMYIIYTSGTTGMPKGTRIFNYNVVRLLFNDFNLFDFNLNDVWTMFHSYTFDFSVWEMYGALLYGGKLVIISEEVTKNVNEFLEILKIEKVTVLNQTPAYFYKLKELELQSDDKLLNLRYVIFGGEALTSNLLKDFNEKYPNINLINMYGITETTVHVTYKKLEKKDLLNSISNIGKPIPTLKVYILDKKNNLLPIMSKGEICVAGLGVGGGYLNRDDLNKEKFIYNPFILNNKDFSNDYSTLYKSGDVGYINFNGEIVYCGRNDNQIKIRGFRIEIGEVENKLKEIEELKNSVVIVKKTNNTNKLICFYVNKQTSVTEIINKATKVLPVYMIPIFIKVDEIKLTRKPKSR